MTNFNNNSFTTLEQVAKYGALLKSVKFIEREDKEPLFFLNMAKDDIKPFLQTMHLAQCDLFDYIIELNKLLFMAQTEKQVDNWGICAEKITALTVGLAEMGRYLNENTDVKIDNYLSIDEYKKEAV